MLSFEQEVREFLDNSTVEYVDNSGEPDMPDFAMKFPGTYNYFYLEVKEKRQHVKTSNWPQVEFPEEDLVLIDELSARRLMRYAPNSGIMIRDNLQLRYIFIDVTRLWLMPRIRVNRPMSASRETYKGKWMINLRNGVVAHALKTAMTAVQSRSQDMYRTAAFTQCVGRFIGEEIPVGGEVRQQWMKEYDYWATR